MQAYLFLVKKLELAPGPTEEIQITSVTTASPAVPETLAPDPHTAPPPGDSGIPLNPSASIPAHVTGPQPTQHIFPPVPIKMLESPPMMSNPMGFRQPQPLQQILQNTTSITSPTTLQG